MRSILCLLLLFPVQTAYPLEHSTFISSYEIHNILAEDVESLEITLSQEVQVDACNDFFIDGDFYEVSYNGSRLYVPYLGEFGISKTEMLCDVDEPGLELLSETFSFEAKDDRRVGLRLILPAGFTLSIEEIK